MYAGILPHGRAYMCISDEPLVGLHHSSSPCIVSPFKQLVQMCTLYSGYWANKFLRCPGSGFQALGLYSFCGTHCPCMSLYLTSAIPAHRLWSLVPFKYHTCFVRPSASLTSLAMASCSSTCLSLEWFLPHTAYMIVTLSRSLCPSERSMIQLGITGTSILHPW